MLKLELRLSLKIIVDPFLSNHFATIHIFQLELMKVNDCNYKKRTYITQSFQLI